MNCKVPVKEHSVGISTCYMARAAVPPLENSKLYKENFVIYAQFSRLLCCKYFFLF